MSTIQSRSGQPQRRPPADNPFFYGFRYVAKIVNGRRLHVQEPLTPEDVLHPREGDHVTQNTPHNRDCIYLLLAIRHQLRQEPDAMVVGDFLIDWGLPGMKGHGPDLAVLRDVPAPHPPRSINVAAVGARPALLIEVTSPSTRTTDLHAKRREYWRAQVPIYVIVDEQFRHGQRFLRIIPYRGGSRGYRRQPLDSRGWFWLEAVQLWLGQENGQVALYDSQGQRIPAPEEEPELRRQAEERATQAEQQVTQEKERAARLVELSRKARQGAASPEELRELEQLEKQILPP